MKVSYAAGRFDLPNLQMLRRKDGSQTMKQRLSSGEMKELIASKLSHNLSVEPAEATDEQFYFALALIVRDLLQQERQQFIKKAEEQNKKKIYYLCMEFLMGRSLKNNLFNLGLEQAAEQALGDFGVKLACVYDCEPDAGLGNGGLGRLAACFLDGLATGGYPATGYSLLYEYGIFRQKIVDGWQTELPDSWLPGGDVWLVPHPENSVTVQFDGTVTESWDGPYHTVSLQNATPVTAIPFDLMNSGYDGKGVSLLRLWKAQSQEFSMDLFNEGEYMRAIEQKAMAEVLTKVLYPGDNHPEGKSLRLSQQYFLVSATVQDIMQSHLRQYGTLENLPETMAIHLNDTHPVLAIPEMMRILLDECGYSWDHAWDIVTRTVAYTNHTVMAEALECWSVELFGKKLPRILEIVCEINKRFCRQVESITGGNQEIVSRMSIIRDGIVKMANLAVAACHSVNGVSKLHSEILKETVFHDFYTVMPYKFKNVTNGIAHRRWLCQSNPGLTEFLTNAIGEGFITDASELKKLTALADDASALDALEKIKHENKQRMAKYILKQNGLTVDPNSIFDVQVKRLHEYKRQLLNALNILATYQRLRENPNMDFVPRTYIFGAKAAPGYYFAKEIIRFIVLLGNMINSDASIGGKMKVVYLEDYRVTVAEQLMPAADVSEQISLAGTEASGTGNMKLMINGALTVGTLDGANVEICSAVGRSNMFLFGMNAAEVDNLRRSGYRPRSYYDNNQTIRAAVDQIYHGIGGVNLSSIGDSLLCRDPYMVLADFADYAATQSRLSQAYADRSAWNRMSLVNIANAGIFSADRAIRDYASTIWGASPVK